MSLPPICLPGWETNERPIPAADLSKSRRLVLFRTRNVRSSSGTLFCKSEFLVFSSNSCLSIPMLSVQAFQSLSKVAVRVFFRSLMSCLEKFIFSIILDSFLTSCWMFWNFLATDAVMLSQYEKEALVTSLLTMSLFVHLMSSKELMIFSSLSSRF